MRQNVRPAVTALLLLTFCLHPMGCTSNEAATQPAAPPAEAASTAPFERCQPPGAADLHNVFRIGDSLYNGSAPKTAADFDALRTLGVQTIVAVDGARPDQAAAAARGMRYVHLPISYDNVPPNRIAEYVRAVRDLPGPIYVHCLHGEHRSPAVTAAIEVSLGRWQPAQGEAFMKAAGVSPQYPGLYESVRHARPLTTVQIDAASAEFPAAAAVSGLASAMVDVDRAWGHLKELKSNDWRPLEAHPDVDAANEARQVAELLAALVDNNDSRSLGTDFVSQMDASRVSAEALWSALRAGQVDAAHEAFDQAAATCRTCHNAYRN